MSAEPAAMALHEAVALGILQGLTEFLPVSSSAHLVVMPAVVGSRGGDFAFDVLVQLGTLVAVFLYFRLDLLRMGRALLVELRRPWETWSSDARLGAYVVLATIPAVVAGLLFRDRVAAAFSSPRLALIMLLVTAVMLVAAERSARGRGRPVGVIDLRVAVAIGLAQACALLPGLSRSGLTIAAGMLMGLGRPDAARFSFLLAVPVLLGAGVVTLVDLASAPASVGLQLTPLVAGFSAAALSGYLVIRWFLRFVASRSLVWYAAYCTVLSVVGLALVD